MANSISTAPARLTRRSVRQLPLLAWAGIIVGLTGVLILALVGQGVTARRAWKAFRQPAALCGLGAGSMFACAAMTIKLATAELSGVDTVGSALVALVVVMAIRSSLHLAWSSLRDHRDIARWQTVVPNVESAWPAFGGRVRMLDIGFAAAPAALVRIVGQVEVIFTIAFARYYLRDKVRVQEMLGLLLVAAGVIMALLAAA